MSGVCVVWSVPSVIMDNVWHIHVVCDVVCVCVHVSLYGGTGSGARLPESMTGCTTRVNYLTSLCLTSPVSTKRAIIAPTSK